MTKLLVLNLLLCCAVALCAGPVNAVDADDARPANIVYILADDQGFGDAACYNRQCGIPTPGIDRIAHEGMRFTDAHSASAVCTPTRYGLLTGRYPWRTRLQRGVLGGNTATGHDPLIAANTLNVGQLLKQHGYHTACVGKWHLGFRYELPAGEKILQKSKPEWKSAVPAGTKLIGGPTTRGFDHFEGFHHAGEMSTWIEQDRVTKNFHPVEMLPHITEGAVTYIEDRGRKRAEPFFLYVPLSAPHGPLVPSAEWQDRSGLNVYADFVMQVDDTVLQILDALDRIEMASDTLVVFTADNGCSPIANLDELREKGHDPMGGLRGHKADVWEGGHRVPFVVRWPGVVEPGSVSNEPICLNSLIATCAEMLGVELPEDAGVDSFSILPVLKGETIARPTHPIIIHHSISGMFAIRQGDWKYLACKGSGGWSKGNDGRLEQLYNLSADRAERDNLVESMPDIRTQLSAALEKAVADGRTTPGPKQSNDVPVVIRKSQ